MKKALKRPGSPERITTDGPKSYRAAMKDIGNTDRQDIARHVNNRVENSHLPFRRRERAMRRFRRMKTLQNFASVHANVHNPLASPPFGSILNAASSIAKPSSNAAQPRWPSGNRLSAKRRSQSPSCIVERQVRTRLTAPSQDPSRHDCTVIARTFCYSTAEAALTQPPPNAFTRVA